MIKLQIKESPSPLAQDSQEMLEALSQTPANSLSQAAWEGYLTLFAPVYPAPAELPALRLNYRSQVWSLLAAAGWVEHPAAIASCQSDPDRDGQSECILASKQVYAQFEIDSGALTYLFQRDPDNDAPTSAHQIIGPSSQIISGLSDPKGWKLSNGLTADPAVIPGAFTETGMGYQSEITEDEGNGGLQSKPETNRGRVMSAMSRMTKPPCQ